MAHFYGNLKGSRGMATRCGTASSGLSVSARSWAGSVTVRLDEENGETIATISASHGSAVGGKVLWSGPVSDLYIASALYVGPKDSR